MGICTLNTHELEDHYSRRNGGGGHFFDRSTKRFFNSRTGSAAFKRPDGTIVFTTSERFDQDSPRLYTVRFLDSDGEICDDHMGFQGYETSRAALKAARQWAAV